MGGRGYIIIARKIFDHPLLKDPMYFRGWLWLISEAAWAPYRKIAKSGRTKVLVNLLRGELAHGREFIARALNWTPQRVRTFLNHLENDGMISRRTVDGQIIISICNYDAYQVASKYDNRQTNQQTNQLSTTNQPQPEDKPIQKKDIARSPGFEIWYSIYPRKKQPHAARRAYDKVIATGTITTEELLERTNTFAASWALRPNEDLPFCPYPASWLNKGGYADDADGLAGAPIKTPPRDLAALTDAEWSKPIQHWRDKAEWSASYYGPPPGEPGCLVPARLLITAQPASTGR